MCERYRPLIDSRLVVEYTVRGHTLIDLVSEVRSSSD